MHKIPALSADLVDQLPNVFPVLDSKELLALNEKQLGFHLGQQSVIEFLRMRLQQTKDEALDVHA